MVPNGLCRCSLQRLRDAMAPKADEYFNKAVDLVRCAPQFILHPTSSSIFLLSRVLTVHRSRPWQCISTGCTTREAYDRRTTACRSCTRAARAPSKISTSAQNASARRRHRRRRQQLYCVCVCAPSARVDRSGRDLCPCCCLPRLARAPPVPGQRAPCS